MHDLIRSTGRWIHKPHSITIVFLYAVLIGVIIHVALVFTNTEYNAARIAGSTIEGMMTLDFAAILTLVIAILTAISAWIYSRFKKNVKEDIDNDIRMGEFKNLINRSMSHYKLFEKLKKSEFSKEAQLSMLLDAIAISQTALNISANITNQEHYNKKNNYMALAASNIAYFACDAAKIIYKLNQPEDKQDEMYFEFKAIALDALDSRGSEIQYNQELKTLGGGCDWWNILESVTYVTHWFSAGKEKEIAKKEYERLLDTPNLPPNWKAEVREQWEKENPDY